MMYGQCLNFTPAKSQLIEIHYQLAISPFSFDFHLEKYKMVFKTS